MSFKKFSATQGIVGSADINTIYQREIFFPVDPKDLDWVDQSELGELFGSSRYFVFEPDKLLHLLPELEAEIFWLHFFKKKRQNDIGKLLNISQSTVSYRLRRITEKLRYLFILELIEPRNLIQDLYFIKEHEKLILGDLFYYTNQEMVGERYDTRQSTVKWIFTKSLREVAKLERTDPDLWNRHLAALLLLEKYLPIRVMN